jgi:hypothetical protein
MHGELEGRVENEKTVESIRMQKDLMTDELEDERHIRQTNFGSQKVIMDIL